MIFYACWWQGVADRTAKEEGGSLWLGITRGSATIQGAPILRQEKERWEKIPCNGKDIYVPPLKKAPLMKAKGIVIGAPTASMPIVEEEED